MKPIVCLIIVLFSVVGCGGPEFSSGLFTDEGVPEFDSGTGGAVGSGGSDEGTGGAVDAPDGAVSVGDAGGSVATGGAASSGGRASTGGVTHSGGAVSTGGALVATGGAPNTGGTPATGGVPPCDKITHDNGFGATWTDCVLKGTYNKQQALRACAASGAQECRPTNCGVGDLVVCGYRGSYAYGCWGYEGRFTGMAKEQSDSCSGFDASWG